MSVLIKGMDMPKACVYRENGQLTTCPLYDIDGYCGGLNIEAIHNEGDRLHGCPLIPVPPHGDLIDRDPFIEFIKTHWDSYDQWFVEQLEARPIIIPAEEGEL